MCETPSPPEKHLATALQQDCLSARQTCSINSTTRQCPLGVMRPSVSKTGIESREIPQLLALKKTKSNQESHHRTSLGKLGMLNFEVGSEIIL